MTLSNNPFGQPNSAATDDFDMNDFVNFDQGFHNSPTPTSIKMEPHQSLDPRDIMLQSSAQARQQYNGPSHNYDQFRQQTGLPTGAISHVHAVNQFSNSNHVKPTNFAAAHFAGYNTGLDLGLDSQTSPDSQEFYIPGDNSDDFAVDPSAVAPDSRPSTAFRAWPGMHSQQAKQQAQAQADSNQQRRDEALQSQQTLPSNFEQTFGARSRSETNASEEQANEQISRLLNQMRQNSNASADDNEDGKAGHGSMSLGSGRRPDDDMDEDERLLNSEEGKKLSSKERRQLRNKVSARAFRSRRKEYITQLESELATKSNEGNDLKMTNRHLLEQNRQLTQLCKAMLSHPSFGNFMDDMSKDPALLQAFAPQSDSSSASTQSAPQQQQQKMKHEPPPQPQSTQSQQQQQDIHVGMAMMPETNLDMSMLNLGANHWTNFQQPQIFALYDVPTGPSAEELSSCALSGKEAQEETDDSDLPEKVQVPSVKELPALPEIATQPASAMIDGNVEDIIDDANFALYVDEPKPTSTTSTPSPNLADAVSRLEESLSEKPSNYYCLNVQTPRENEAAIQAIDRMFARAEPTLRRMQRMTRYLDA